MWAASVISWLFLSALPVSAQATAPDPDDIVTAQVMLDRAGFSLWDVQRVAQWACTGTRVVFR